MLEWKVMDAKDKWKALEANNFYPIRFADSFCFLSRPYKAASLPDHAVMTIYRDNTYFNQWNYRIPIDSLSQVVRDGLPPVRNQDGTIVE